MNTTKYENLKMKERYLPISVSEIMLIVAGAIVFLLHNLSEYRLIFIIAVIGLYWLKIRLIETKIQNKKQEIYNVFYDKCKPVAMKVIEGKTRIARKPLEYEMDQLEFDRKCLVDKFVVINLILMILIQLFF